MKPTEIKLNDWQRIFLGTMPPIYYLEILGRVIFIYLLIVFCMRLMGKRMSSHLTRNEMIALTSLAAAVGMPILSFDKGLLPAAIVALLVVVGQRIVSTLSCISPSFERATQGDLEILLENGRLNMDKLSTTRISKERLFSMLRENEFIHLGQLKRIYFEANGTFNLISEETPKPGLCILPPSDESFLEEQTWITHSLVCNNCGASSQQEDTSCKYCHHHTFVHPVDNPR